MLTPEIRYDTCEGFRERINKLFSDVEDVLSFTYAPYGQTPDEDTPFFERLFLKLERLNEEITKHSEKLYAQWSEDEDLKDETHLDDVLDDVISWKLPELHMIGDVAYV